MNDAEMSVTSRIKSVQTVLQCDRAMNDAEIPPTTMANSLGTLLQCDRAMNDAEMTQKPSTPAGACRASM